jgi:hypothetical protein
VDYQVALLIALILLVVILGSRDQRRSMREPSWRYQRVISAGFAGLLFLVAGLIGWDLQYSHEFFQGTTWTYAPIWWQVGLGTALLALAGFWARRVPSRSTRQTV